MERRSLVTSQSSNESTSEQVKSLNRTALSLCREGRFREAIALFDQIIQLEPDNYAAWYGRGDALANLKHYQDALNDFNRAILLNPYSNETWTFRGVVLLYLERFQEALESCERALKLQPTDREAWAFRGAALHHLNRYKEAYTSYDRATGRQRRSLLRQIVQFFRRLLYRFQSLKQVKAAR